MSAYEVTPSTKYGARHLICLSLVVVIASMLLSFSFVQPASASPNQAVDYSVGLDGAPITFEGSSSSAIVLGSPASSGANAAVLGGPCDSILFSITCTLAKQARGVATGEVTVGEAACNAFNKVWGLCDKLKQCSQNLAASGPAVAAPILAPVQCGKIVVQELISPVVKAFLKVVYIEGLKGGVAGMDLAVGAIMGKTLLGDNGLFDPIVDCNSATGDAADQCKKAPGTARAFLSQVALMRQLALLMLAPLLMLLVIQAVVRGSLYFLLRSFLIMLPVAVIGTVLVVTVTQLLLNISNDVSRAMVATMGDPEGFVKAFKDNIKSMDPEFMTFWTFLWIIFLIAGGVAVFVELMLREVGVYLSALFLPLAFAGLVWPATAKWARRLIELLIALIFSKVVITAAFMLGMNAIIHGNFSTDVAYQATTTEQTSPAPEDKKDDDHAGFANLFAGVSILIMAAFAGGRVMALTPAAMAHSERAIQPSRALSAGQVVGIGLGRLNDGIANRNRRQGKVAP